MSLSVALLLPAFVSIAPPGAATIAVLVSVPVAAPEIFAATVYVTEPPAGTLTVSLIFPLPLAVQVPPPAPTHVHVPVKIAGNISDTVDPEALLGPEFATVMV